MALIAALNEDSLSEEALSEGEEEIAEELQAMDTEANRKQKKIEEFNEKKKKRGNFTILMYTRGLLSI
jgi:hypothetical protein